MDDLEKAIVISFDESGAYDSLLKSQAVAYCQQIKETQSICSLCIQRLSCTKLPQVQFWCLQTLQGVIKLRYASSMSLDEKFFVRTSVFSMACLNDKNSLIRVLDSPAFVKNKLAHVLVTLIYFEYPAMWPSVFLDFINQLSNGVMVIDMFSRVLNALDDELISLDYPRTPEEATVAGMVKDNMREQCVPQIVSVWYQIVSMYKNPDPELAATVLDTMRRYITWIDINLIVNGTFISLLFELILADGLAEELRGAAAGCVSAVISKRMDGQLKLSHLQSLQISRVFGLVTGDSDSELVASVAELISAFAVEVLECYKRSTSENAKGISMELLNEVLPSVFYIMQNCEVGTAFSIVQFLSCYVATMKSLSPLKEKQVVHIGQILEVIRTQIKYDSTYRNNLDVLDKIGREEEERMTDFRKDLFVLLRSVGRVAPEVTHMFIRISLDSSVASTSERNVEEVEAALSLLYALGESMSGEAMRSGNGLLRELVPLLLSTKFPCHSSRLVALVYLEAITRYMKFVHENSQYIPMILTAFLDERGIHHPNVNVSRRASYLFMRVVKLLKSKLVPFMETILQSLQDTVAQFTSMDYSSKDLSGSEDGSHIFEAIGLLIGMEEVQREKQSDYLLSLLTPLCQQVEALLVNARSQSPEESSAKIASIQQIIMAINALSKGFSERLVTESRPAIGLMFKQTLDVLLQVLVVYPKIESLRSKVTSFIHRMVDTLGSSVFPFLPTALGQLLAESEPKEMVGFLVLINQLICKFNTSVLDLVDELFPAIASRVFNTLPKGAFPSGPESNTEEIRELQELQRTLYTFLHVITTQDLSSVFLSPKSQGCLDPMMQMLAYTSCNHKDINTRKACVQIFIKLIRDWYTVPKGEEKVPGLQNFLIRAFAINCCLHSVLDKSFDLRDANTLVLFGEIVTAQAVMYEKFGDDFLIPFVAEGFPVTEFNQNLAEAYCKKLQDNDIKALKSFYRSLIENLRLQQNGSLDFR